LPARLIGDEPVPVVIWLDIPDDARAEGVLLLETFCAGTGGGTVLDFTSA